MCRFIELYRSLFILSFVTIGIVYHPNVQEADFCPMVPAGLHNVVSLEWLVPDEVVLVSIGDEKEPEYMRLWFEWNLRDTSIEVTKVNSVIPFLVVLQELGLEQELSYPYFDNEPLLTFSPSMSDFVYSREDDIYHAELQNEFESASETFLGTATFSDIVDVTWLSDDELIVVSHPPYGDGFEIARVCLREGCSFDNFYPFPFVPDRPGVDPINKRIAAYDLTSRLFIVFDVVESPTPTLIEVSHSLLPRVAPIWDSTSNQIYMLGTNPPEITILSLDLNSQTVSEIAVLDDAPTSFAPDEWLFSLDNRFLIATSAIQNREVSIYCF